MGYQNTDNNIYHLILKLFDTFLTARTAHTGHTNCTRRFRSLKRRHTHTESTMLSSACTLAAAIQTVGGGRPPAGVSAATESNAEERVAILDAGRFKPLKALNVTLTASSSSHKRHCPARWWCGCLVDKTGHQLPAFVAPPPH